MPRKKLERRQITLEPVAGRARHDQVARIVRPAAGERHHMIQRRRVLIEMRRAVHTPLTAITQRPLAQRVFHGDMHHRRPRRTARTTAGTCPRAHRRSARRSATTRRRTVAAATQLERWTSGHTSQPLPNDDAPAEAMSLASGRKVATTSGRNDGDRWSAAPPRTWELPRVERIILLEHQVDTPTIGNQPAMWCARRFARTPDHGARRYDHVVAPVNSPAALRHAIVA